MAALFNTGNYEHIRYEVTAEVPRGGSATATMIHLRETLGHLRPIKLPYDYARAKEVLAKDPLTRNEREKDGVAEYQKLVGEVETARALRRKALEDLDQLGGASRHRDAKDDWNQDDSPF